MQMAQVATVITTGRHFTNTYSQLIALQQEKHFMLNNIQELQHGRISRTTADSINRIQENIISVNRQINDVQSEASHQGQYSQQALTGGDRMEISNQALVRYNAYYN